jgi:hypothetical protein
MFIRSLPPQSIPAGLQRTARVSTAPHHGISLAPPSPDRRVDMQLSRISAGLGMVMLLANVALAQKVTTDYSKSADFSQYRTFMWIKEPHATNPLTSQRIVEDVNAALTSKGLTLVTADADLCVAAHAATQKERTLETFYDGFGGGWRWRGGFGSATTMVNTYTVGSLVVDIFDGRTKEAVWRGTSSKTLSGNPEKNAQHLNEAIRKMFRNFPPTGGKHGE